MSQYDPFVTYDAAYVLGALSPAEREEYEAHLRTCADCSAAVAGLAGMPGLLARVPAEEVEPHSSDPPDTLLPRLLGEVRRERHRSRRMLVSALSASAACLVAVLVIVFWPGGPPPSTVQLKPAASSVGVTATARFQPTDWGTKIELRCVEKAGASSYSGGGSGGSYTMFVADRAGRWQEVGSWRAKPGASSTEVYASTGLADSQIAGLQVRTAAGRTVLRLDR